MPQKFSRSDLAGVFKPSQDSNGEDNGQVTIIGGSELFHGAPLLSLQVCSRIVDMVFLASPKRSVGRVAEQMKSKLLSFIWVPWADVDEYIKKSDAILIGPGLLRFKSEKIPHGQRLHVCDEACQITKNITQNLLQKFPGKNWVIDAGSLQTMSPDWIPANAILTPNKKEYQLLFGNLDPQKAAKKYNCIIVVKGPVTSVYSGKRVCEVSGGNPGLTKGGTGDVQSGLTAALLAKNDPFLSACAASFITKSAADELQKEVGIYYNADDLADQIPHTLFSAINAVK